MTTTKAANGLLSSAPKRGRKPRRRELCGPPATTSIRTTLSRRAHIEGRGGFNVWDVRFERSDDGYKEEGLWPWAQNPFNGTRELQGLKVLMALINNWDLKTENNKIVRPDKKSGGRPGSANLLRRGSGRNAW